jgi:hypothetical protein
MPFRSTSPAIGLDLVAVAGVARTAYNETIALPFC